MGWRDHGRVGALRRARRLRLRPGGTAAVGIAGLVRLLPAALVAPFAASFGDHFKRERFLAVIALIGAAALAGSAVAFFVGENVPAIFALSAVVGLAVTLVRPAQQALLPHSHGTRRN